MDKIHADEIALIPLAQDADLNDMQNTCAYILRGTYVNAPGPSMLYAVLFVFARSATGCNQIVIAHNNSAYRRARSSGVWTEWLSF